MLAKQPLLWEQRSQLASSLCQALDVLQVDVADLRQCDTVFAAQVVSSAQVIYSADEAARQRFEMLTLAQYARLNEQRHGILQDIRQRGSIYK